MANVLNRATKQYVTSVHTPDFDPTDWVVNPSGVDALLAGGVPTRHWKIAGTHPNESLTEMTQAEKDAVDDDPANLAAEKAGRHLEIDARTEALITEGHTFAGKQFSLSSNAQRYVGEIRQGKTNNLLSAPLDVTTLDHDTHTLATAADIDNFYASALNAVKGRLDSGRTLKKAIFDAATRAAVDAVVDTR